MIEIYVGKSVFREIKYNDDWYKDICYYSEENKISEEYSLFKKISKNEYLDLETKEVLTSILKDDIVYKEVNNYKTNCIVKYGVCDLELVYKGTKSNLVKEDLLSKKNAKNKIKVKKPKT